MWKDISTSYRKKNNFNTKILPTGRYRLRQYFLLKEKSIYRLYDII